MKRLSLTILFAVALSYLAGAQSLVGKWSQFQTQQELRMELSMEFFEGSKVILSVNGVMGNQETVMLIATALITGKYESEGKALCIMFNNDATSSSKVEYSDFVGQQKRAQVDAQLAPILPEIERRMATMLARFTSAGLYSQILQVNDTDLIIKHPNSDPEHFKRQ